MAFAGFSPGEAEGLRRAMSRKRSAEAIEAYHQRFLDGARETHGVGEEVAERVYGMIVGFSGFGFPKAHGAAFGLLAYQSTWLRVHHGPEFICALLNEQPMGFYAPDTLAHESQRRGIALAPAGRERERRAVHGRVGARDGPFARRRARRRPLVRRPGCPGLRGRGRRAPREPPRAAARLPGLAARRRPRCRPPRPHAAASLVSPRPATAAPMLASAAVRAPAPTSAATARGTRLSPRRSPRLAAATPERDRPARARVHARGQGGGGQGARRRSRGGRAVPFAGGSRLAGGCRAALAGPARVGGCVRLADRRLVSSTRGGRRCGSSGWRCRGSGCSRGRSSRCRWRCRTRRRCGR